MLHDANAGIPAVGCEQDFHPLDTCRSSQSTRGALAGDTLKADAAHYFNLITVWSIYSAWWYCCNITSCSKSLDLGASVCEKRDIFLSVLTRERLRSHILVCKAPPCPGEALGARCVPHAISFVMSRVRNDKRCARLNSCESVCAAPQVSLLHTDVLAIARARSCVVALAPYALVSRVASECQPSSCRTCILW